MKYNPSWFCLILMLLAGCAQIPPRPTLPAMPASTPTSTPSPAVGAAYAPRAVTFEGERGIMVPGEFYPAPQPGASALVLLHGGGGHGQDWVDVGLVDWLQGKAITGSLESGILVAGWQPLGAAYNILVFDCYGHYGATGRAAVEKVEALTGLDARHVATIGSSAGADGALQACEAAGCAGALALSAMGSLEGEPFGVTERRAEAQGQVVWCVATIGDGGCPQGGGPAYRTWDFPGAAHGYGMLGLPGTEGIIREYLQTVFPAQIPSS